jgi:hypothetical protein
MLACPERCRALTKLRHALCARRPESQKVRARKEHVSGVRGMLQRMSEGRWRRRRREEMYCERQYDEEHMAERPERIMPLPAILHSVNGQRRVESYALRTMTTSSCVRADRRAMEMGTVYAQ